MKNINKVMAVLLACFICIMSIPFLSHASSGGTWHWTSCSTGWNSTYDDNYNNLNVNEATAEFTNSYNYRSLNSLLTKANVYQCELVIGELSNAEVYNYYLSSDNEIVLLYNFKNKTSQLIAYSKSEIYGCLAMWRTANGTCGQSTDFSQSSDCKDGAYFYHTLKSVGAYGNFGSTLAGINSYNLKVFDDVSNIKTYFETGSTAGMLWDGNEMTYDADSLYCTKMDIIYHDSNVFDNCYIEFIYELPDNLKDTQGLYLRIFEEYNMGARSFKGGEKDTYDTIGYNNISLDDNPFSYKLYLKDLECLQKYFSREDLVFDSTANKKHILGYEYTRFIKLNEDVGDTLIYKINLSKLYLYANLCQGNVMGEQYNHSIDLINGSTDFHSSRPDESGNYTVNDDYKKTGHYYNEVGTDAAGNTTNKYYYYGDDNSKVEISAEDFLNNKCSNFDISADNGLGGGGGSASGDNSNNNVNNPTFNNNNNVNVTVEGDSINNDVDNVINNDTSNSKENSDSFIEKFLGFFTMLENNSFLSILGKIFGWLPSPVYAVITGSIGIVAGVSVFRFFRK